MAVDKVNFDDAKQYCKDIVLGERTKPQGNDKSNNILITMKRLIYDVTLDIFLEFLV